MQLELSYTTTYAYQPPIAHALTALRIRPRTRPGLRVMRSGIAAGGAKITASYVDGCGTLVDFVECQEPASETRFEMRALVETEAREVCDSATDDELHWFLGDSARVRRSAIAPLEQTLELDGSRWDSVETLVSLLRNWFTYRIGATSAQTPIETVVTTREGVCQDFAHVMIGVLRAWGWPARYVSGYAYDGVTAGAVVEAEAMHAWVEVYRRGLGWVGLDATTGSYAGEGYVPVGHGRDYDDLRPVRGVLSSTTEQVQRSRLSITYQPDQ